ncbi:MAG: hypothetical protein Q4C47_08610, partial [Planctomycetia bacterium]|nr:hypothetical protein [Planctomycetia bacterium]
MTTESPDFLFFDMGNVLITFDLDVISERMAKVAGVEPRKVLQSFFGETGGFWDAESGQITSDELYESFCQATDSRPDPYELNVAACSTFAVNTPILPVLVALRRAGNRLGILSNICEAHWLWCIGHYRFLTDIFDCRLASYELGYRKPDREIFVKAAQIAGATVGKELTAERIFFTDDVSCNVRGAVAAGWD